MTQRYPIVIVNNTLQELPTGDSIAGSIETAQTATKSTNLANGSSGSIPYQLTTDLTSFLPIGPSGQVLTSNGSLPSWQPVSTLSSGSSALSTNLSNGATGSLPYQAGPSVTAFLSIGGNNDILTSNGSEPRWKSPAQISVGSATNLAGGTPGGISYQSSAGVTSFLPIGANNNILTSNGTSPRWSQLADVTVGLSTAATNLSSGLTGSIPYQASANTTTFLPIGSDNTILTSTGAAPEWANPNQLTVGSSTNISSGTAGSIPYQASPSSTIFLNIGGNNTILTSNGTAPRWTAPGDLTVGNSTTSANIAGGNTGSIPYQVVPNSTTLLSIGPDDTILTSNGSTPEWRAPTSLTVGFATSSNFATSSTTATNLAGGSAGSIPYQTSTGTTNYISIGIENYVLTSNGNSPYWSSITSLSAGSAVNANFLLVGTEYRSATVDSANVGTPNAIACRDASGNLNAVLFQGQATAAAAADLAEKYLADQDYEVGTVVTVGGELEVTACKLGDRAFGAVSNNPAYMMNAELAGGTYIALKGRVPVKVVGSVKKGDKLVAANNGCAGVASELLKNMPFNPAMIPDTFAIALETNTEENVKLVECIVL